MLSTDYMSYFAKNPNYGKEQPPYKKPTEEEWERIKEILGPFVTRGFGSIRNYEQLVAHSKRVYEDRKEPEYIRKHVDVFNQKDKEAVEAREDFVKWDVPY